MVLIDHFGPPRFWYTGRLGVVLFFVLSGLFMGRLLFVKRVRLADFFAKRFSRVIPTLWVYVGVMLIYSSLFQSRVYHPGLGELASVLTFTSTYFMSIWEAKWPIGQLWSLNVEEHGYVFLAIGAVIVARSRGAISASVFLGVTLAAVCVIVCMYMSEIFVVSGSPWRTRSEVACLGLVASAAICVWRERGQMDLMQSRILPIVAMVVALYSFIPRGAFEWNFSLLVAPVLLAFAVNYASSFPEIVKQALSIRPLRWFGTCSFSIYLWQGPFYEATLSGRSKRLSLVLALLAGAVSFYGIERPARNYLNRKWDERKSRGSANVTVSAELA